LQCGFGNILPYKEQVGYCVVCFKEKSNYFCLKSEKTEKLNRIMISPTEDLMDLLSWETTFLYDDVAVKNVITAS